MKDLEHLKILAKDWLRLRNTNIERDVIHCSFPFPCECCIEAQLVKELEKMTK